ncbi:hypothetical protein D1J60_19850 [Streptomyces sp. W1SF4]|nr:hypothetical protein D1J60_19850 [Streptomyces sp. W1SF4]
MGTAVALGGPGAGAGGSLRGPACRAGRGPCGAAPRPTLRPFPGLRPDPRLKRRRGWKSPGLRPGPLGASPPDPRASNAGGAGYIQPARRLSAPGAERRTSSPAGV